MYRYFVKAKRPRAWQRPSLLGRLPTEYYRFRQELKKPQKPVHEIPKKEKLLDYYVADPKTLRIERKPDVRIPAYMPPEANDGIWAGDGIVKGYVKPKKRLYDLLHHVYPRIWFPKLYRVVVYSEILDKYMAVNVTDTAIDEINKANGFDLYILTTPVQDLKSQLALDLRRKMLITLAEKNFRHKDEADRLRIYEKYKQFTIPLEEAKWFGLTFNSAVTKQALIEQSSIDHSPLKIKYAQQLIQKLQELKESEKTKQVTTEEVNQSIFTKLKDSFFKSKE